MPHGCMCISDTGEQHFYYNYNDLWEARAGVKAWDYNG